MTITDKAIEKLKTFQKEDRPILRVYLQGGGCSGHTYKLMWEEKPTPKDEVFSKDGFIWCIDPRSYLFIKDVTIDYEDGLNASGFVYDNPAAKRVCGCGESFS